MKKEQFKINSLKTRLVEFSHHEKNLLLARFERIQLAEAEVLEEAKYLYFIYVFRRQHMDTKNNMVDIGPYNIICFNKIYHTFKEMMEQLNVILAKYILSDEGKLKCLELVHKLNPNCYEDKE